MSFFEGLSHAAGISLGMRIYQSRAKRPIQRKRFLANLMFTGGNLWILFTSISLNVQYKDGYEALIFFPEFLDKYYQNFRQPFFLPSVIILIAFVVYFGMVAVNSSKEQSAADLGWVGFIIMSLLFVAFTYYMTYDIAYYLLGNQCVLITDGPCINFANKAHGFAMVSSVVYMLRSSILLLPSEKGVIVCFGKEIRHIDGGGFYIIPTLPVPHFVYVLSIFAFELMPFLYDFYHVPDGRESATQLNVKN